MRRVLLLIVTGFILNSSYAAQPHVALAPGYKLGGMSAVGLSAAWWQWALSSPKGINPVVDETGAHCAVGQKGRVWFLAGGFGSSKIQRRCAVPAKKYLFFPLVNVVYYPREENNGYACELAKSRAAVQNDAALDLFAEVDGVPLKNLKRYRARTKECFDVFERVDKSLNPYNAYPSASDGYWLMLRPLSKGTHTIKFGGRYNIPGDPSGGMVQDIEYEIAVE